MTKNNQKVSQLCQFWEKKTKSTNRNPISRKTTDSISCSVTSIMAEKDCLIHQVQLECTCCASIFILRAAHECNPQNNSGLEWIQNSNGDNVHVAL